MPFTEEELQKIKADLPRGASITLAEKFKLNPKSIRRILSGHSNNEAVILAAFEIAKDHQAKIQQTKEALSAA